MNLFPAPLPAVIPLVFCSRQGNAVNQDNDETVELEESDNSAENSGSPSVEDPGTDPVQQKKQRTYAFDETADENLDEEIGMATQYMPSSMGITFIASGNTNIVRGSLTFATYRNGQSSGLYDSLSAG